MCCSKTPKAQIFFVTSVSGRCFFDKRAVGLEFDKFWLYKWIFESFSTAEAPQAGIIKLEWWVEANFWKKPEVRDDLTTTGMPKISVSKHGSSWVKLSLWPFCGWIPRPAKAIWTTFDFKRMQSVQHFAGRIGWLDTYKNYGIEVGRLGIEVGRLACCRHGCITQAFLLVRNKEMTGFQA